MKAKVVVILGPTATGKSHCGIGLAKNINGEIISGDSMLIYRGMNIATAKPSDAELAIVPHHLVDILNPFENYNVVDFKVQADEIIKQLNSDNKMPIVVGGTGLYIKALLENYQFNQTASSETLRADLLALAKREGNNAVYEQLLALAPKQAQRLHPNNLYRVIRAIEAAKAGETVSQERSVEAPYDAIVFGLTMQRNVLYERINHRVDIMVKEGLFEETEALLASGVPKTAQAMRGIGYKQAILYLEGLLTKQAAIDDIKQATRNFAKRQFTWYKKMPYVQWYELEPVPDYDDVVDKMTKIVVQKFNLG